MWCATCLAAILYSVGSNKLHNHILRLTSWLVSNTMVSFSNSPTFFKYQRIILYLPTANTFSPTETTTYLYFWSRSQLWLNSSILRTPTAKYTRSLRLIPVSRKGKSKKGEQAKNEFFKKSRVRCKTMMEVIHPKVVTDLIVPFRDGKSTTENRRR